ncbi:MAG: patatin family protein [Oscillospiraceae bacterium]|nr:patatin family protein [Oscillospiraceae bacterium]
MKTGLILEGGAMRGLFSCGVLDVLAENHIRFDGAAGISAGAVFGCNFKSGQIGRAVRYNKKYCRDRRYCSLWSLFTTGDLYGADFCYRELPDVLDPFDRAAFRADPMPFWIGATDVETGRCLYHLCSDGGAADMAWMRASASMPMVSRPVEIDGLRLLDGGIADPVPYAYMEGLGFDRNVIVLTQPRGYRKQKSRALPLIRFLLRKMPRVAEAMQARTEVYNRQMDELDCREDSGAALVIRPPEALGISRTEDDPDELERVYQLGRREGLRRLDELRAWLTPDGAGILHKNREEK